MLNLKSKVSLTNCIAKAPIENSLTQLVFTNFLIVVCAYRGASIYRSDKCHCPFYKGKSVLTTWDKNIFIMLRDVRCIEVSGNGII